MITAEKIRIYKKYLGNIEDWDRFGKKNHKKSMNYDDWVLMDSILDDLFLVKNGLASDSFQKKTYTKLEDSCDTVKTQNELISLIGKYK